MKTILAMADNESPTSIATTEADIGKQWGGRRRNFAFDTPTPEQSELDNYNNGLWDYRNANLQTHDPVLGAIPIYGGWSGVVAGNADAYLAAAAQSIIANFTVARPYMFSPHHEQNVCDLQQAGIGTGSTCNGSAAQYVAFYRYVVTFLRNHGVGDKVKFCCVPNVKQYQLNDSTTGISVVDPGSAYVDIYGCDAYNNGASATAQARGLDIVGNYAAARGKLAMIGEFGIHYNTAGAATYLQSCLDLWKAQGNWVFIATDVQSCASFLVPVWQGAAADPTHFAFKGEQATWPGGAAPAALGIALETDSALAITHSKSRPINITLETDTALPILNSPGPHQVAALTTLETDAALPISASKSLAIGVALETDSDFPIVRSKMVTLGIVPETDSAFTITPSKSGALGIALETDVSLAVSAIGKRITVNTVIETDVVFSIVASKDRLIGVAVETDSAISTGVGPNSGRIFWVRLQAPDAGDLWRGGPDELADRFQEEGVFFW